MNETDPRSAERSFYDETDYADVDLEVAENVRVTRQPAPRSTFALRLDGSTIDQLRELARRRGTRPTQLAREWLIERLAQERREAPMPEVIQPADQSFGEARHEENVGEVDRGQITSGNRLEDRIANLERAFVNLTGSYARGATLSASRDADLVSMLEARAQVARELRQRLDPAATVEAPADAGADLVVRRGRRTWVIEIEHHAVDILPSFQHVLSVATQLNATPVLVSPQVPSEDIEVLSKSSGVFVARLDKLDGLLAEITSHTGSSDEETSAAEANPPGIAGSARERADAV